MTDRYFRALAKIAFHYYLIHTRRATGSEKGFAPIRRFIMDGGTPELFLDAPRRFGIPPGMASPRWCHILGAAERDGLVIGYVRLFFGPFARQKDYHFMLGRLETRLVLPEFAWAHAYIYDEPVPAKGQAGEVQAVNLRRMLPDHLA
jgi:hypothetical protein